MRSSLTLMLFLAAAALGIVGCSAHYHGYPHDPYRSGPLEYHHYHRLPCGHLVECHYHRGVHHYRAHPTHRSYWHMHYVGGGRYVRCEVVRGHHYLHHR